MSAVGPDYDWKYAIGQKCRKPVCPSARSRKACLSAITVGGAGRIAGREHRSDCVAREGEDATRRTIHDWHRPILEKSLKVFKNRGIRVRFAHGDKSGVVRRGVAQMGGVGIDIVYV